MAVPTSWPGTMARSLVIAPLPASFRRCRGAMKHMRDPGAIHGLTEGSRTGSAMPVGTHKGLPENGLRRRSGTPGTTSGAPRCNRHGAAQTHAEPLGGSRRSGSPP